MQYDIMLHLIQPNYQQPVDPAKFIRAHNDVLRGKHDEVVVREVGAHSFVLKKGYYVFLAYQILNRHSITATVIPKEGAFGLTMQLASCSVTYRREIRVPCGAGIEDTIKREVQDSPTWNKYKAHFKEFAEYISLGPNPSFPIQRDVVVAGTKIGTYRIRETN